MQEEIFDIHFPLVGRSDYAATQQDRYGVVNEQGDWVITPRYESLIQTTELDYFAAQEKGLWGLINDREEWLIQPILEDIPFWVREQSHVFPDTRFLIIFSKDGLYGMQNEHAQWVMAPQFSYLHFSGFDAQGLCLAGQDDHVGFIDAQGNWVIPPHFESATPFNDTQMAVVSQNGTFGVINLLGEWVIPPIYAHLWEVANVGFIATLDSGKKGLLDLAGQWILSPMYEELFFGSGRGQWVARENGLFGFLDLTGTWLLSPRWEEIKNPHPWQPSGGLFIVRQQEQEYLVNEAGKIHFRAGADEFIDYLGHHHFQVISEATGEKKILNNQGQVIPSFGQNIV